MMQRLIGIGLVQPDGGCKQPALSGAHIPMPVMRQDVSRAHQRSRPIREIQFLSGLLFISMNCIRS